ncbi:hypothetical protein AB0J25_19360 [Streptomyces sp. NPDC049910]|uniref:hypothetical protein n=1 Tax=Streptomyces sp. NPDC049910 TaxID=3155278 RepID=UPI00343667E6
MSTEERASGRATDGAEGGTDGVSAQDAGKAKEPVKTSADESTGRADGGGDGEVGDGSGTGDLAGSGAGETPAASAAAGGSGPSDPAGPSGAEQLEIPKQQSVGEAADNGAGQGARQ